jgi:hypothetical protein
MQNVHVAVAVNDHVNVKVNPADPWVQSRRSSYFTLPRFD